MANRLTCLFFCSDWLAAGGCHTAAYYYDCFLLDCYPSHQLPWFAHNNKQGVFWGLACPVGKQGQAATTMTAAGRVKKI